MDFNTRFFLFILFCDLDLILTFFGLHSVFFWFFFSRFVTGNRGYVNGKLAVEGTFTLVMVVEK